MASNPPAAEPGPGSSAFVVGPSSINFDDQDLNRERLSTLRVQNTGSNPLKIQAIQISPPSAFEIADNSCDDASILPGNECVVGVAFRPTEAQTYRSIITITADGAPAQTVEVSGTGRVDVTATTPDELATEPPVPLAINAFDATPATNLAPTDSTQLCYDISNAVQARLVNQTTGTTTDLNSASSDCVTLTPGVTTTYTLVAQNGDQTTERSVATTVVEPDLDPPSTPVAIAPTGSTFAYCNQPVTLQWNGSVDTNGPVRYSVTLQRQAIATDDAADGTSAWTSVFTQTTDQLQLSTSAPQSPDSYRWNVQAIDSAGNASSSSGWNEFLCINP